MIAHGVTRRILKSMWLGALLAFSWSYLIDERWGWAALLAFAGLCQIPEMLMWARTMDAAIDKTTSIVRRIRDIS